MRSKVLKSLDFSAFINGTDAMKTEQTTGTDHRRKDVLHSE
jgi:hypothetical protein